MTFQEFQRQEFGYECITTFWDDFAIADRFGIAAVKDTFHRAFDEWKHNCKYLTELVIVLNHRCWMHYDNGNNELSELYSELYYTAHDYARENLTGDDALYYYRITD